MERRAVQALTDEREAEIRGKDAVLCPNQHCGYRQQVAQLRSVWHGLNCYYCKNPIDSLAANPARWGVGLYHKDEPGKVKPHHVGCVSERLARLAEITAERDAIEERTHKNWMKPLPCGHAQCFQRFQHYKGEAECRSICAICQIAALEAQLAEAQAQIKEPEK